MEQGSKTVLDPAVHFEILNTVREGGRDVSGLEDYRRRIQEGQYHIMIMEGGLTHLDHLPSQLIHGTTGTDRGDEGRTTHLRWRWRGWAREDGIEIVTCGLFRIGLIRKREWEKAWHGREREARRGRDLYYQD
jgi:hypothetical protein